MASDTLASRDLRFTPPTFSPPAQPIHLLVLVHGMWGKPSHLAEMKRIMTEARVHGKPERGPDGETLHILAAATNRESGTYDGIDWGGERVADEVSRVGSDGGHVETKW